LTAGRPIFKADSHLIISANLPYLTPEQIKKSPSIKREPKLALDGGVDGLKYYQALFKQLSQTAFRSATVLCEIDPGQVKNMRTLVVKYFPAAPNSLQTDLSGQDRLFVLELTR
jgi:release factor glutamine methyltransferase